MRALQVGKPKETILRDAKLNLVDQSLEGVGTQTDFNMSFERDQDGFSQISVFELGHIGFGPGPTLVDNGNGSAETMYLSI